MSPDEWLRMLIFSALNRCGFKPNSGQVRQAKFCLRVFSVFFSGISRFSPHLTIDSAQNE